MRVVLENKGYEVDSAKDSEEGMRRIKTAKPDLIILDVMMTTAEEGFNVSRSLKQNPAYKSIPIIMVTSVKQKSGLDFKPVAGDETWLPVEEFLDKPVKPDVLLKKVAKLLQKP
jgi:CheY-like chemotaxis protein